VVAAVRVACSAPAALRVVYIATRSAQENCSPVIIWAIVYLSGFTAQVVGLVHVVRGIRKKEKKRVLLALALPVLLWIGIYALHEADRRFIEEEIRKNGGNLPEHVW
jgi:hypothetical protein